MGDSRWSTNERIPPRQEASLSKVKMSAIEFTLTLIMLAIGLLIAVGRFRGWF